MNPLLFADWRRMNRLFTKLMWTMAAIMACVVLAVLVSVGGRAHAAPSTRAPEHSIAGSATALRRGATRGTGASR